MNQKWPLTRHVYKIASSTVMIAIKDTLRVQRESALQMLGANKTASSAEYYFLTLVCITRDRLFNSELPMALWWHYKPRSRLHMTITVGGKTTINYLLSPYDFQHTGACIYVHWFCLATFHMFFVNTQNSFYM